MKTYLTLFFITISFIHYSIAESLQNKPVKDTITWLILNDLEYKEAPHEVYGTVYLPEFSKGVKKLANKQVLIKGYLVPVDKTTWALSKNTYAACFFCGKATFGLGTPACAPVYATAARANEVTNFFIVILPFR